MEKLLYNVSQILGTTIIHSLWQGLLIYTALQLVFLVTDDDGYNHCFGVSTVNT